MDAGHCSYHRHFKVQMHTSAHIQIQIQAYRHMYVCMHTQTYVHMHTQTYVHMYILLHMTCMQSLSVGIPLYMQIFILFIQHGLQEHL